MSRYITELAGTIPPHFNGSAGSVSQPELDLVQVRSLNSIIPAPENDDVYNAIAFDDPEIIDLARSIKEHGVQEPLLISRDGFIISGHRRRVASYLAGLEKVRSASIRSAGKRTAMHSSSF